MADKEKPLNMASYHSKIVGVTFDGRQSVINLMTGDEQLRFRREPDNEYDSNAVAIDALVMHVAPEPEWLPIGYIARDKNAELADTLTNGRYASIKLSDVTGGGDKAYGVNVYIEYERPRKLERSANAILVKDYFGNEIYPARIHKRSRRSLSFW
jgi:single-stranded-DNA-specific exonuclease